MTSELQDVRSLAQIYKSGDLMLQNPAESCIIFVCVVLVSACLEWVLQKASNIDNKYARMMVETMTQEITIVGVLALMLMFGISAIPRGAVEERYITLFTWANMCLFFMAFFFVTVMLFQFFVSTIIMKFCRVFEDGRMDAEELEALHFHERIYKQSFEVYASELQEHYRLTTGECPFHEFLALTSKKHLVKMSNLSYRTWLSLTVVIIVNLCRAKLTPFLKKTEDSTFSNAAMFIGVIGFGILIAFASFVAVMTVRLNRFVIDPNNRKKVEDGSTKVPLGAPNRGIEFIQCITISINWYMTLFVTGQGRELVDITSWRLGIIITMFALPIICIFTLLPVAVFEITLLSTMGSLKKNVEAVQKIVRRARGEFEETESDEDSDDDVEMADLIPHIKKSEMALSETRSHLSASNKSEAITVTRPAWLEDDDYWDGTVTRAYGDGIQDNHLDYLYYNNIDAEELDFIIRRTAPELAPREDSPPAARPTPSAVKKGKKRKPSWKESDDDL